MKLLVKLLLFFILLNSSISHARVEYYSSDPRDTNKETLILFDSSGSMAEKLGNKTRIEHAADAVFNILQEMPDDEQVGLRTIGVHPSKIASLMSSNAGRKEVCKQTYLHAPIRKYNEQQILSSLRNLFPFGPTPLAYSLRLVVENDFQHFTKQKHIILITDGYESCEGNPCEYIKYLMTIRKDITIDVVAIGANKYDLSHLGCLTDATGGSVYNIQKPSELKPIISELTQKVLPAKTETPMTNIKKPEYKTEIKNILPKRNIQYKNYLLEFYD